MAQLTTTAKPRFDVMDKSVLEKIGNTPIRKIEKLNPYKSKNVEIYAKLEWYNAGGSVKARPALRMIADGEKSGKLTKGKIILDSTSGNTGIAYALIGLIKGYKVKLVMPDNVCIERKRLMAEEYHAEIVLSDPLEGSDGAILVARKLYKDNPDIYFLPDQYNNPSNWKAHFDTTAKEIYRQTEQKVTHFIGGLGTGGTVMGTGRGLKSLNPMVKVYGIEPAESLHGIEGLKHMPTSIIPGIYDKDFLDGTFNVKTERAYEMVRLLGEEEGLNVGHSSGAALVGALELAGRLENAVIATVFPDSCEECSVMSGKYNP